MFDHAQWLFTLLDNMAFWTNKILKSVFGFWGFFFISLCIWLASTASPQLTRISSATMLLSADDAPTDSSLREIDTAHRESFSLPYFSSRSTRNSLATIAYTLDINSLSAPLVASHDNVGISQRAPTHGILFAQIINGGDFYLNGVWIAGLPRSNETERRMWYRPMLIPLPDHLLHHTGKTNVLTVVQTTHEPFLLVGNPYFGTMDDVRLVYEVVLFLSATLASASNLFSLVAGLFLIGTWLANPKDKIFAFAGSATMLWALLFTLALLQYMPVSLYPTWRWFLYVCEAGFITLLSMFVLSFAKEPLNRLTSWGFIGFACVAPIVYAVGGVATENWLDRFWTGPMVLMYLYASYRLAVYCLRTRYAPAVALLVQSLISCLLAFHDYGVLTGVLSLGSTNNSEWHWFNLLLEPIYLTHLGLPLLLFVMGKILLNRYQAQVKRIILSNKHLKNSLRLREQELAVSHKKQTRLERIEAATSERERIYQDVHDGIGSRLIATLFSIRQSATLDPKAIEAQLQSCLDDLRLVIDTQLNDTSGDIQSTVFDYCVTIETQLEKSNLIIAYDISDGPAIHLFSTFHINVLRILQESITNVIKHAHATSLLIELHQTATTIILTVTDNGLGLPANSPFIGNNQPYSLQLNETGGGRGLPSLVTRAERMGGRCNFSQAMPGTKVQLTLPIANEQ